MSASPGVAAQQDRNQAQSLLLLVVGQDDAALAAIACCACMDPAAVACERGCGVGPERRNQLVGGEVPGAGGWTRRVLRE